MISSDIAFTPAVKAIQSAKGSRDAYAAMEARGGFRTEIDEDLAAFLAQCFSFYLATSNAEGQPYIQHRGGPPGFLRVLGPRLLGFADFAGNRQYITLGNLAENPRAYIFVMDYQHQQRVKIWGRARVVEDDPDLIARLKPEGYRARIERAILFEVAAWNGNCRQHIPQLVPIAPVARAIETQDARLAALEAENERLRAELDGLRPS